MRQELYCSKFVRKNGVPISIQLNSDRRIKPVGSGAWELLDSLHPVETPI